MICSPDQYRRDVEDVSISNAQMLCYGEKCEKGEKKRGGVKRLICTRWL